MEGGNIVSNLRDTLSPRINELFNRVEMELKKLFGDKLKKVILFGSCSRGDFEASDVDMMALVDEPHPEKTYKDNIADIIMTLSVEYDVLLSLFLENEKEYEEAKLYEPLLERVAAEGIAIYAA